MSRPRPTPLVGISGHGASRWVLLRLLRWIFILAVCVFLFRLTGCMERLFYVPTPGSVSKPGSVPRIEDVWFRSADGTLLHGWFIPARLTADAAGRSLDSPLPTILHVHGNAGNIESHVWFTEYLPDSGFNLFIFDYRGYGQSEGTSRKRADLIADTNAALDALLQRDDIDPARIGMYGQSLGGAIGLNIMADRPEIRAAVFESPFCSWREIAANVVGGEPPNLLGRFFAWLLINDTARPLDAIGRIDRPILLLHGNADSIIPVSHSHRLAAAAPQARLIELQGGDHNSLRDTHPEIEGDVVDFFRLYLK